MAYNAAITGNESGVFCVLLFEALARVHTKRVAFIFRCMALLLQRQNLTTNLIRSTYFALNIDATYQQPTIHQNTKSKANILQYELDELKNFH